MGRVIVVQYITLDGVVEDPDGSGGTPFGGWAMRYGPEGVAGDKFRLGDLLETGCSCSVAAPGTTSPNCGRAATPRSHAR